MMRTLSCKRMARMISLYVAGDLMGAREREVAAHLAACEGCRRLAEEFSDSGSLLTEACMPPEFGEEFYSGIRNAVLGEIARGRMLSKPSLFRRRWFYATAFAAVVIAAAVMLQHFVSVRRPTPQGLVVATKVGGQSTSDGAKGTDSSSASQVSASTQLPRKSDGPRRTPRTQSQKFLARVNARRSSGQSETKLEASVSAQTALDKRTQIAHVGQWSTNASTSAPTIFGPAGRVSPSQVSRIEIQTADPNIRIIWLTPQETREPAETNHDPDQQKNGKRR